MRVLLDGGGTKDILESLAVIGEHVTVIDETLPDGRRVIWRHVAYFLLQGGDCRVDGRLSHVEARRGLKGWRQDPEVNHLY